MDPDLRLALELADVADEMAAARFRGRLHIEEKPDGSLVTDVDRDVETALRERIAKAHPGDAVLGEEFGGPRDAERLWVLDPLDGTGRFIRRGNDWGAIIALVRDGQVAVGVMTQPVHERRWWACRGEGAWSSDGRRLQVSGETTLSMALLCDDHRGNAARGRGPGAQLLRRCRDRRSPRGMPMLMVVAEGQADVAVQIASPWDLAAAAVIVEEAGGRFSDTEGGPRFDAGAVLASNGRLHEQALRALVR